MNKLLKASSIVVLTVVTLTNTGCQDPTQMQSLINLGTQLAGASGTGLSNQAQLVSGLKNMLDLSSSRAGAFLSSANVWSMMLPPEANKVVSTLRSVGMGNYVNKIQGEMNNAAAKAAVAATPVFKQAINDMTITDALQVWRGGNSAATQYFRNKTENSLRSKFAPIIQSSLQQTGYYNQYKSLMSAYNAVPFASKPNIDVEGYMMDKTMDAMFSKMATEEADIRQNPQAKGTALIQSVMAAIAIK